LRIIALARKNSLFFGNDEAGERFAVLYSLIATCEKHSVNRVPSATVRSSARGPATPRA
jgi:hypothetical protein